jgi:opacity protein-like surface antigen
MKKIFAIAASALVLTAPVMSAQEGPSAGDVAAYLAVNSSTVGAPTLATNTLANAGGIGWHLQYGRLDWGSDVTSSTFAGGFDLSVGSGRLGVTAGYMTVDCPAPVECDGHMVVGTRYSAQLAGAALSNDARWAMGLEGELGFGFPQDESAMAIAASVPVKLTLGKNIKISPFLAPGFAYGRYKVADESESGQRFMIGGGVGLAFANGIGANLGMRKVFIEEGKTQIGLGFTLRPGSTRSRSKR